MKSLAIVTGASRGIGRAIAEKFLGEGWDVFNLARTPCPIDGVVNYTCDLADFAAVRALLGSLDLAGYRRISIIHNAALLHKDSATTLDDTAFIEVLRMNLVVPQIINQALLPALPPSSSILFIGSTLSETGAPGMLSYTASKHGLVGLMKATSRDLEGKEIHTCMICPGFTDTEMLRQAVGEENIEQVVEEVLFHRLITPEEIAELTFFCSGNPVINRSMISANLGQKSR